MKTTLLHIFRNSPTGRENLMQSAYFCKQQFGLSLAVCVPETIQFGMEFNDSLVTVQLDGSYVAWKCLPRSSAITSFMFRENASRVRCHSCRTNGP